MPPIGPLGASGFPRPSAAGSTRQGVRVGSFLRSGDWLRPSSAASRWWSEAWR